MSVAAAEGAVGAVAVAAEEVEAGVVAETQSTRRRLRRRMRRPCRLQTKPPQRWQRYAISLSEYLSTSDLPSTQRV